MSLQEVEQKYINFPLFILDPMLNGYWKCNCGNFWHRLGETYCYKCREVFMEDVEFAIKQGRIPPLLLRV